MTRSVDELLFHTPAVARCEDKRARGFAQGILRQSKRRAPKQRAVMQRLVNEMFSTDDAVIFDE